MKKEGWKYDQLGNICDTLNGLWKGKKEPFVNVGVIRNANFTKDFTLDFSNIEYLDVEARQYAKRKLQKGDLIVEKSGGSEKQPVGRTVLFDREDGDFSFSNFTSVLRIKDAKLISPKYLYKFLLFVYLRGDTRTMQKATTGIHNIEFDKFLSIQVPVPPLKEQEEIVAYLDGEFERIEKLKRNAEAALQHTKDLFQSTLKQLLTPKPNWEEKKLKEIGLTQTGTTPSKSDSTNYGNEIPFIRPSEINIDGCGGIEYDSEIKLSQKGVSVGRLFSTHSILMVCIGATISKVGYTDQPVSCNQQINVLTPKEKYDCKFIYYAMSAPDFKKKVIKEGTSAQATLPIINKGKWEQLSIRIPPLAEQQAIVSRLDTLSEHCRKLEQNYRDTLTLCDDLKQALLREVFE